MTPLRSLILRLAEERGRSPVSIAFWLVKHGAQHEGACITLEAAYDAACRFIPRPGMGDTFFITHNHGHSDERALCAITHQLAHLQEKLNTMSVSLETTTASIESKLDEASVEILADLAFLRAQVPVSPEVIAALDRIEAKAAALASVSPAVAVEPDPA